MSYIFRINGIGCNYLANTEWIDKNYETEKILDSLSKYNIVIAQPIFNKENPLHHSVISKLSSEVIFVPYIYLDGLYSLEATDIDSNSILGSDVLAPFLERSYDDMVGYFQTGRIDFRCRERLDASLAELHAREKEVDSIVVSDFIEENWHSRPLIISHNHPNKWLMDLIAERLFRRIDRPYQSYDGLPHYQRAEYLFSKGEGALSPYDADRLGLEYEYDDQWWTVGRRLLHRYWKDNGPAYAA